MTERREVVLPPPTGQPRPTDLMLRLRDILVAGMLFLVSTGLAITALRDFRADGAREYFYQENFGPAVMMACGHGFGLAASPPPSLAAFLNQQTGSFSCDDLANTTTVIPVEAAAHANWYYLYYATAAVWRVTGVSWGAVDYLAALLCGAATSILFGLFRLVSGRTIAAVLAMVLTLAPPNLLQLLSVRDYSKAPFVLGALLTLAILLVRPMRAAATVAMAGLYGVIIAVGYGFRGDLAVMLPLGAGAILLWLPGAWRQHALRNVGAAIAVVLAFGITALPVLRGLDRGGCQFHVALLGLTTPLTNDLALASPIYRFGDHLTDTFAILKTGDYATRVLGAEVPPYCQQVYDVASGQLYFQMLSTFPADFAARALASALFIFRWALEVPDLQGQVAPLSSIGMPAVYRVLHPPSAALSQLGLLAVLGATMILWSKSWRLGLAWCAIILFLGAYPAIQFEGRHWFHVRVVPWFAALIVASELVSRRRNGWQAYRTGAIAVVALLVLLTGTLAVLRQIQQRSASALFESYQQASSNPMPITPVSANEVAVLAPSRFEGPADDRRQSELMAIRLSAEACAGSGPLVVSPRYEALSPDLDLSTDIEVPRPRPGEPPTQIFVPVFGSQSRTQTFQQLSGLRITGASAACLAEVSLVDRRAAPALWLQVTLEPGWRALALNQGLKLPRAVQPLFGERW